MRDYEQFLSVLKYRGSLFKIPEMFSGCKSLTSLDLSGFDTTNVTEMSYLFENCQSLKNQSITVTKNTYDKMLSSNIGISLNTLQFK